ncbi:hypothetical protein JCM3766R1_002856 [Sporobolomyces carnicolor]
MFGKTIDPSCYSGTFFEYCASSTAKETCCGICTVVPIAYPGTLIGWVLGSFCNLLYALIFRAEAPYNLLFQFLSVDAALISLIDRFFEPSNRIDLWDYCFVPMSICSCIPVAVAVALGRIEDLHVIGPGASIQLRDKSRSAVRFTDGADVTLWLKRRYRQQQVQRAHDAGHQPGTEKHTLQKFKPVLHPHAHQATSMRHAEDDTLSENGARPGSVVESDPPLEPLDPHIFAALPHAKLPKKLIWFYFGHLVTFTIVFAVVYLTVGNTSQSNCNDEFAISTFWRPLMAGFVALNLAIGWFFCFVMYVNVSNYQGTNRKFHGMVTWSGALSILQRTGNTASAVARTVSHTQEKYFRVGICFLVYLVWAGPYIFVWIKSVNEFMLLGPNPWLFEYVYLFVAKSRLQQLLYVSNL